MKKLPITFGDRVVVTSECKSKGRVGVVTKYSAWERLYSVRLDATSDKRVCGIRISPENVERV